MNHKRAQYTKSKSKKNVFLHPVPSRPGQRCRSLASPSLSQLPLCPAPSGLPRVANHRHQPRLRAHPLPRPPPMDWSNLRLNPAFRRQLRPSAAPGAPGVLCGSRFNPANLHNDEALQCRLGLKRVGKKYALSFGEAHRRLGAAREECSSWQVGGGGQEPAAHPPRTAQLCRPLSLCPAGPAEEGLPRAVNQQEVRYKVPAPDSGRTDPGHSDRHSPAG